MHCQVQDKAVFLFFQVVPQKSEVSRSCKQTTEVEGEIKVESAKTNTVHKWCASCFLNAAYIMEERSNNLIQNFNQFTLHNCVFLS